MPRRELYEDEQKIYDNFIEYVNCSGADDLEQEDIIELVDNLIDAIINNEHREVERWTKE